MPNNIGLYSLQEFSDKFVAKLAPDAFVTFMGSTGLTVALGTNSNNFNFKSGVASINASASTTPGAGTCNISYICPQYTSLNDSYYVTQPDGTKTKFFQTMMEVRVYAKARFLKKPSNSSGFTPVYHPVFWGYVAAISESYSGSETTFSLTCRDVLSWWEYVFDNNIAIAGTQDQFGGGTVPPTGGNLYRNMNAWEVILNLFKETSYANFVYPTPLNIGGSSVNPNVPDFISNLDSSTPGGGYDLVSKSIINDWINRFNLGKVLSPDEQKASGVSNLEMFGVSNIVRICDSKQSAFGVDSRDILENNTRTTNRYGVKNPDANRTNPGKGESTNNIAKDKDLSALGGDTIFRRASSQNNSDVTVDLNFGILDGVLPFGDWQEMNGSFTSEPNRFTKLQVASTVAEAIQFEFFQDTNGSFVFKPPFYNMDVSRNPIYTIKASDIITFEEAEDSSVIKNYAVATGSIFQEANKSITVSAWHIDAGSIRKYGLRETRINLLYGANSNQLRALTAGEMAKNNAKSQTASLTIPMRTEIRLGYPVYIDHIDAYYYVKNVSHSITFGSTATTTLTLEAKRSKVYGSDGSIQKGYIFKAFATKQLGEEDSQSRDSSITAVKKQLESSSASQYLGSQKTSTAADTPKPYNSYYSKELTPSEKYYRTMGLVTSPEPGFYNPVQLESFTSVSSAKSDAVANAKKSIDSGALTELVLYTDSTTPYTDINGYLHIGSFPYGATMVLKEDMTVKAQQLYDTGDTAKDSMNIVPDGASKGIDDFGVNKDVREDYGEEYSPEDASLPEQRKPLYADSELLKKKSSNPFFDPDATATATYNVKPF